MIGNVYFDDNVIDLFLNGLQEEFNFDFDPVYAFALPNSRNLITSLDRLRIYDENWKCIQDIDKINDEEIKPYGVALNIDDEKTYIADCRKHRILMIDFEFNLIKSVGSQGTEYNQFDEPFDLCLLNNNLYVCDSNNNRIQVLNNNLEFLKSFEVDYKPYQIKPLNSILAVQAKMEICFYNSSDLSLIQKYDHGLCVISKLNSNIYGFNNEAKKLFSYDEDSNLSEVINFTERSLKDTWDGALCERNGVLFVISNSMRKIIKFSHQLATKL